MPGDDYLELASTLSCLSILHNIPIMAVTHDGALSGGSLAVDEETDLALLVRLLTLMTTTY